MSQEADELRAAVGRALLDPGSGARVRRRPLASRQRLVGDVAREDVPERELLLPDERRDRRASRPARAPRAAAEPDRRRPGRRRAPRPRPTRRRARRPTPAAASASRAARAGRSAPREHPARCPGSSTSTSSSVALQRSPSRTIPPPSIRCRRISSRKNGLPSARSRIRARVVSGSASTSSRWPTSSRAESALSGPSNRPEKLRLPPPQVGWRSVSSGRAGQTSRSGPRTRSATSSRSSSSAGSAQWMSSTTATSGRSSASAENSARHARCSSTRTADGWSRSNSGSPESSPSVNASAALIRSVRGRGASARASATTALIRSTTISTGSSSLDVGEVLQDLGKRPVRDPLAVRRHRPVTIRGASGPALRRWRSSRTSRLFPTPGSP